MENIGHYFDELARQAQWDWKAYVQAFWWIGVIALVSYFLFRWIFGRGVRWTLRQFKPAWSDVILSQLRINTITWIAPITVVLIFTPQFIPSDAWLASLIQVCLGLWVLIIIMLFLDSVINAGYAIYCTYPIAKTVPIKPYIQTVKVIFALLTFLIVISILIGVPALVMISGIGALIVGMSFIFKDAALGLVAGIQMAVNHMVSIGDWIEQPGTNLNGNVIEISLTNVKVQNFDNSIIMVPTYDLVSKQLINWGAMQESGGRRFKISIPIDTTSVTPVSDHQRKLWIEQKIIYTNTKKQPTNLAYYRAYLTQQLQSHPAINQQYLSMVRNIEISATAIIVEVYGFTNTTIWKEFETIKSDLLEQALIAAQQFYLSIYRAPAGSDFQNHSQT